MEQNKEYKYKHDGEVDLKDLGFILIGKIHLIFLTALFCALIGTAFAMFMLPEKYESKTSIYIYNQENESITYSDLQTGTVLTKDYEVLVKGRAVLETVVKQLDLKLTYEQINSMVSVSVPTSTRIVEISVRTADPYLSKEIADTVREVSSKNIAEVMGVDAVNIVEQANLPEKKCSPSIKRHAMIGGMLGVAVASAIVVIMFLLNDTIRTQDDVENYLGLSVLGIIPLEQNLEDSEKENERKTAKRKSIKRKR